MANADLKKMLKERRPKASDATIKTYASLLQSLFNKGHKEETPFNIEWFRNTEHVLPLLSEKTPQTRKTNLAAIIVLLEGKDCEQYAKMMTEDAEFTKENYSKQEKTEKQEANWLDYDEIVAVWNEKYKKIRTLLYSPEKMEFNDIRTLVYFMITTITSGIFFPPRRSEWISLKVKGYDSEKDNYLDMKNSCFVFHNYKTSKTMGEEKVQFPKEFKLILAKYLKLTNNDYLIFNSQGNPYSNVALAQQLNTIFGKKISTSMLRHIYLSHRFKNVPSLKELQGTADSLGHSVETMLSYIVK